MKYDIVASMLTDVGCCRETNEDSGRCIKPANEDVLANKGILVVVADGMGGHSAGEVASRMAVDVVSRAYYENGADAQSALNKALIEANREIYQASLNDESLRGMGTTCTALALQNGSAISAHVGDCRLYLVRGGDIYQMTEDHSPVMEMVKRGLLSLEEARQHPDKNVILRALGTNPEVEVSTWDQPFPIRSGDQLLLCSDGLYDLVEDKEIKEAVLVSEPHVACSNLIRLAKDRGGYDNITVGVLSISQPPDDEAASAPDTREVEIMK